MLMVSYAGVLKCNLNEQIFTNGGNVAKFVAIMAKEMEKGGKSLAKLETQVRHNVISRFSL